MNSDSVLALYNWFKADGITVWIDGGWGVDALVGRQTRSHNDIDVFVQKDDADDFIKMITSKGYKEIEVEFTTESHTAWQDSDGRLIDFHLFEFGETGAVFFEGEEYPSNVLNGEGKIDGVSVKCLSASAQLLYHQGYEHDENDVRDVMLLCETFGFPVPAEYR